MSKRSSFPRNVEAPPHWSTREQHPSLNEIDRLRTENRNLRGSAHKLKERSYGFLAERRNLVQQQKKKKKRSKFFWSKSGDAEAEKKAKKAKEKVDQEEEERDKKKRGGWRCFTRCKKRSDDRSVEEAAGGSAQAGVQ